MFKIDEFFRARLKLTFIYTGTIAIIIAGFSLALYYFIISNLKETIEDTFLGLNPNVAHTILERSELILQSKIFFMDAVILIMVVVGAFLFTDKTLRPIRESMNKQKRFIADASHELRTPIAVVISGLEVSLRNKNPTLESFRKTIDKSLDEMRNFAVLTNQLLDISKYENTNHTNQKYISMNDLIQSTANKIETIAKQKVISISTNLKHHVRLKGSSIDLARVLSNTLTNAITHTEPHGQITITDNLECQLYTIAITDNGCGIKQEVLGRIFEPFFQAETSHSGSGAGLGLTMAKKIIENHDGSIDITSVEGHGTTVKITLPITL